METSRNETLLSSSDIPEGIAPEQPLPTPHFDEISIQHARPAVPLAEVKARRFWPLALVLMLGSSLVGGVMGIALSRYENSSEKIATTPAASVAPEGNRVSTGRDSSPSGRGQGEGFDEVENSDRLSTASGQVTSDAGGARATLQGALDAWVAATNARDIQRQMNFYNQKVNAFYLTRNVPRSAVRAEKSRVFSHANRIDIRAGAPGIRISPDGRTATMRFRKKYAIEGGGEDRRGEVVQELRWQRTDDGWKIVSERDLRVIN